MGWCNTIWRAICAPEESRFPNAFYAFALDDDLSSRREMKFAVWRSVFRKGPVVEICGVRQIHFQMELRYMIENEFRFDRHLIVGIFGKPLEVYVDILDFNFQGSRDWLPSQAEYFGVVKTAKRFHKMNNIFHAAPPEVGQNNLPHG